jgi:hypothetical protein
VKLQQGIASSGTVKSLRVDTDLLLYWRLLLSPQGACGGAAGAYRKPAGPPIRWAMVTFPHPLRNAKTRLNKNKQKTRLGQLHFRDPESISARPPPVFGETSASRAQGRVDTPPVRPRGLAEADPMSAAVEGTGKDTFYTSHGVRLGKIAAFNPPGSKWYIRAMKYKRPPAIQLLPLRHL